MRDAKLVEILIIKEMPKRTMPDIVQQRRHADQTFDVRSRRHVRTNAGQRFVPVIHRLRREMHRSKDMLKPHVLGRRKHKPGGLQLVNVTESLNPRVVDDLLLSDLPLRQVVAGNKRDVSVNWIVAETFGNEIARHGLPSPERTGICPLPRSDKLKSRGYFQWNRAGRRSIAAVFLLALVRSRDRSFGGFGFVHQDAAFDVARTDSHEQPACHLSGQLFLTELLRAFPPPIDCD